MIIVLKTELYSHMIIQFSVLVNTILFYFLYLFLKGYSMSENIYERYCRLRNSAGYKDSDVAKGSGITKSTFSDWKNGRYVPKQAKLQKIADFLNVDLDYLINGEILVESINLSEAEKNKQKRLLEYARRLLDLGIDPDDLGALIDAVEKMQKKD